MSSPAPAGRRNTLLTVQRIRRGAVIGDGGQVDESNEANWETASDVGANGQLWGLVIPRGSREFPRGEQIAAEVDYLVEVLYEAGKRITTKMRLVFGGRVLNIAGNPMDVEMRHHSLQLPCTEDVRT